jgi:hypothetical protein
VPTVDNRDLQHAANTLKVRQRNRSSRH